MQPDEHVPFQQDIAEAQPKPSHASWTASLDLAFEQDPRGRDGASASPRHATRLVHRHEGPLRIQKALYPEGASPCHAVIVHPPGGIAGGDRLDIRIDCGQGSHGLVTTPSAAKWYGSAPENPASQSVHVVLDGALEWLAQETIVFNRAEVRSDILVRAGSQGSMIGWDHLIFGRRASGESFEQGSFRQSLRIEIDGRIAWHDRLVLQGGDPLFDSPIGLRGHHAFATVWALLPATARWAEPALEALRADSPGIAWTVLHDRLLVGRLLASPLELKPLMARAWSFLRPHVVGKPAVAPRLWAT
jgi:urease accessory protein